MESCLLMATVSRQSCSIPTFCFLCSMFKNSKLKENGLLVLDVFHDSFQRLHQFCLPAVT